MITFLKRLGSAILRFTVNTIKRLTLLMTLVSVLVSLVMFFMYMYEGEPVKAVVSIIAMVSFVYVNKQY